MRKAIFCIAILIHGLQLHAQKNNGFNPVDQQDDVWSLDFAPVFWLKNGNAPEANKISYSAGLTYHYEISLSKSKKTALAFGLGYNFSSLSHKGIFENDTNRNTIWKLPSTAEVLDVSRLNVHRMNVPFEFRIKLKKGMKIYLGYQNSFVFRYINNLKLNGDESSVSQLNTFQIYQHGPRLRMGYKDFFVFSNFYLSSLFKNKSQTSMNLVEVGISIGG